MTAGRELASHDHVCWSYGDRAQFCSRAKEFLAEGRDSTGREPLGIEDVRIERPG